MTKTQDDNINTLKKELDKGNNFADYFIVIGVKQDLIFDEFLYENTLDVINNSEKINPEILSKFPPFEKTTINVDENMIKVTIIKFLKKLFKK
jgi:hypothetical protein